MARCGDMAGPHKPTWMPTWFLCGVNSDIRRLRLNHAIGRSGLNRVIGRLKSRGWESASWATIPSITRDPTAEITRSEIRVISHDPTDFARSDGGNHTE